MEEVAYWFGTHKGVTCGIVAVAAVLLVALGVAVGHATSGTSSLAQGTPYEEAANPNEDENATLEEEPEPLTPEQETDLALPEALRALRDSYSEDVTSLLESLQGCTWYAGDGTTVMRASATCFTETAADGRQTLTPYVVTAADSAASGSQSFSVTTPSGSYLFVLSTLPDDIALFSEVTLEGDCFALADTWTRAKASADVDVDGPPASWCASNGTTRQAVCQAVSEYCWRRLPTVTQAAWDGTAREDFSVGTTSFTYTCDNAAASRIVATFRSEDATWVVEAEQ